MRAPARSAAIGRSALASKAGGTASELIRRAVGEWLERRGRWEAHLAVVTGGAGGNVVPLPAARGAA
jgi:Arc/MetJ-type ribon-helix-helix transcriptional regulator